MSSDPRLYRHPLGFLQVAHRPTIDELRSYYRDKYFQQSRGNYRVSYSADERAYFDVKLSQRAEIVGRLRGDTPGRFLDVGCGEGFAMAFFASRGWSVEGLDYSSAGLETFHPELADALTCGDLFELLDQRIATGERYQLVWLSNVLEHVLEPLALLESLRSLVADDGVLVVTVPNDGSVLHESLFETGDISERFWIAIPDHVSYFTAESLRHTVAATGWDCLDLIGDFPIDMFLAHEGSNYVRDRTNGGGAHRARLRLERIIGMAGCAAANRLYSALAEVGLGRNITAFLRPASGNISNLSEVV